MVDEGLFFDFHRFSIDFHGNLGFGAFPTRAVVWCSLVFFSSTEDVSVKNIVSMPQAKEARLSTGSHLRF